MISFEDIKKNRQISALIEGSRKVLNAMDYTEHGLRHAGYVSTLSFLILDKLNFNERKCELAKIAGYLHDVGNSINRFNHGITSSLLIYPILVNMGMDYDEIGLIISAIGNHEEDIGYVVNEISAALIIADKSDAHRTRVHSDKFDVNDIHDRVNFSIKKNDLEIDAVHRVISSKLYMDDTSSVMEYFQIYLPRMQMSEKAANFLNCTFKLYINDVLINSPKPLSETTLNKIE